MLKAMRGGRRSINLTISSNQAALYTIFTSAGSPTDPVAVEVTVNSGVILQAGIRTGTGWASGSSIKLINNGTIAGTGGGDTAGIFGGGGHATSVILSEGDDGKDGGDAVLMQTDLTIDNTAGFIYGGGGGGSGGGASASADPPGSGDAAPGGGAGGGRGYNNALGGDAGNNNGTPTTAATDGNNGSSAARGTAGTGAIAGTVFQRYTGGDGGRGGDWGEAGQAGSPGTKSAGAPGTTKPGGAAGAAGCSVRKSGFTLTWVGGNNSTQVKGPQT